MFQGSGACGSVVGGGSFTHTTSTGALVAKGIWEATSCTSFASFGGPNPGSQGGMLEIVVTLFPNGGPAVTGVPMSVTCLINAPPGLEEGTTVGSFTEKTGGITVFHIE